MNSFGVVSVSLYRAAGDVQAATDLPGYLLFYANSCEFRSADYEEIMNKASCLSLLSDAVLLWNSITIRARP